MVVNNAHTVQYLECMVVSPTITFQGIYIRESVDSLCRDGADAQYMQYLSKSRITLPQTRKKLI